MGASLCLHKQKSKETRFQRDYKMIKRRSELDGDPDPTKDSQTEIKVIFYIRMETNSRESDIDIIARLKGAKKSLVEEALACRLIFKEMGQVSKDSEWYLISADWVS